MRCAEGESGDVGEGEMNWKTKDESKDQDKGEGEGTARVMMTVLWVIEAEAMDLVWSAFRPVRSGTGYSEWMDVSSASIQMKTEEKIEENPLWVLDVIDVLGG
jgi:hypothetical protein